MFFRYFSRGFAAGLGFAVGFMVLSMVPALLMQKVRIDIPSTALEPATSSLAPMPASATAPEEKPYSLTLGRPPELTIPEGGGIAFVAIVRDVAKTPRPTSVQYWLTSDQLWRIDTKDDQPTFSKLDYPAKDAPEMIQQRMRNELIEETGMTSVIDRADLVRIDRGEPRRGWNLNGAFKRNADGVVWLLPNPR